MGRKRGYNSNSTAAITYLETYNYFFMRLSSIAMSCFLWEGLPDTVDPRYIEYTLFYQGSGLYFQDEIIGNIFTKYASGGMLDIYDIPMERNAYANNGYQNKKQAENSVIIYDNLTHTNILPIIETFCKRLTNLERTKDINVSVQKTPFMIRSTQQQLLTLQNMFEKIDVGCPAIFADKSFDMEDVKVLDLKAPFLVGELQKEKLNVMQEALSFLGVGGMEIEKSERLLEREIQEAQQASIAQRQNRLKARQQAADKINRMFGLDVSVSFDESIIKPPGSYLNVSRETMIEGDE